MKRVLKSKKEYCISLVTRKRFVTHTYKAKEIKEKD